MKIAALLLVISIFSVGIWSCKSSKKVNQDESKVEATEQPTTLNKKEKEIFASIQRTACYGKCPTYKAIFYSDGTVTYEGKMNVEKLGTYEAKISLEDMNSITARAKAINYFNLEDKYDGNVTDLPACYTSVRNSDSLKEIYNRYEGPKQLGEFEKYLEQLLDSLNWIQIIAPNSEMHDDD